MKLPLLTAILNIRYGLQRVNKCCYNYEIASGMIMKLKSMVTYNPLSDKDENSGFDLIFCVGGLSVFLLLRFIFL